jgi:hypothetical protein
MEMPRSPLLPLSDDHITELPEGITHAPDEPDSDGPRLADVGQIAPKRESKHRIEVARLNSTPEAGPSTIGRLDPAREDLSGGSRRSGLHWERCDHTILIDMLHGAPRTAAGLSKAGGDHFRVAVRILYQLESMREITAA